MDDGSKLFKKFMIERGPNLPNVKETEDTELVAGTQKEGRRATTP
jgi:hypothetical protein